MHKLESLVKKLTHRDPRFFEPPLDDHQLAKMCKDARTHHNAKQPLNLKIVDARVYDCGTEAGEPFTIIQATLSDGSTIGSYQFKSPPEPLEVLNFALGLPSQEWFPLNLERPSQSGI